MQKGGRVFCMGLPVSGVETLSRMFKHYKVSYNFQPELFTEAIMSGIGVDEFLDHKNSFGLDVDASCLNGYVIKQLVKKYPDAKFVLAVRDCYGWLNNVFDYCINERRPHWRVFWDWCFAPPDVRHPKVESGLAGTGLYPVSGYLTHWADYHRDILDSIPPERLLVLKYFDLGDCGKSLAKFIGVNPATLGKGYESSPPQRHDFISRVDSTYIVGLVNDICGNLRYYLKF